MKKLALIFLFCVGFAFTNNSQNQEKEIENVLDKLIRAYNEQNGAKIISLIKDDPSVRLIQAGATYKREQFNKITSEPDSKPLGTTESKWINKSIRIIDSKSAVVLGEMHTLYKPKDMEAIEVKSINTIILEKIKGKWSIVSMHTSHLTENRKF